MHFRESQKSLFNFNFKIFQLTSLHYNSLKKKAKKIHNVFESINEKWYTLIAHFIFWCIELMRLMIESVKAIKLCKTNFMFR